MEKEFHGFTLLTHCGGGAFGDVWYCQDMSGKKLALKIISKKHLGDQLKRELKGGAELSDRY
jgi:serine/threonine protein kinase